MDETQRAAFLQAQAACALIEMEAMKAANKEREQQGYSLAYDEAAFMAVIDKYGIHHNAALFTLGNHDDH